MSILSKPSLLGTAPPTDWNQYSSVTQ